LSCVRTRSAGLIEGSWGRLAIEVKTGSITGADLRGLGEFTRRHRDFRPLVVCDDLGRTSAERAGFPVIPWQEFLLGGPPSEGAGALEG